MLNKQIWTSKHALFMFQVGEVATILLDPITSMNHSGNLFLKLNAVIIIQLNICKLKSTNTFMSERSTDLVTALSAHVETGIPVRTGKLRAVY